MRRRDLKGRYMIYSSHTRSKASGRWMLWFKFTSKLKSLGVTTCQWCADVYPEVEIR